MDKLYEQEKARRDALQKSEEDTNSKNTLNDNGDVNKNG
jgi:hypothetical protein